MAVSGKLYYPFLTHALTEPIDLNTDNIRVSLHTASYTPNQTHAHHSSCTSELSTTLGYTVGGQTLTTPAVTNATATTKFSADNAVWTSATIAARYAVIYANKGADSSVWPLIGYVDFGDTMSSAAGTFTIAWSSGGIFTITTD